MFEYKGYTAHVAFDDDGGVFHGEVAGTRDVITFEGTSVEELVQAFHDSVDDYLEFCAERGEKPDKPFSGNFPVRVGPELHRRAHLTAAASGMSLNSWICRLIDNESPPLEQHPPAKEKVASR